MASTTAESPRSDLIRIEARPHQLNASFSRTVMICDRFGVISHPDDGLYVHDTRMLSRFRWNINRGLYVVESSLVRQNSMLVYAIAKPYATSKGYSGEPGRNDARDATEETIELRTGTILSDGFHQDADITNFTIHPQKLDVELQLAADFCDLDEAIKGSRKQHGKLERHLRLLPGGAEWKWHYRAHHRGRHLDREATLEFRGLPERARWSKSGVRYQLELEPGESAHLCIIFSARVENRELKPTLGCYSLEAIDPRHRRYLEDTTGFGLRPQPQATLERAVERARHDLSCLRLLDLDRSDREPHPQEAWVPAAGIPNYVSTFGRDILTAAWQSSILGPDITRGALRLLRELQGKRVDNWRDEAPGKMLHEAHTGPLSVLDFKPQGRYYGSFNTSPFYIIVLSEFFHWTGDKTETLAHLDAAKSALRWMDRYGHPGHQHFYAFETRSRQGVKNQGWKDSSDALIYPDGRIVPDPIADCPIQGYAYEAKLRMAELLWLGGEHAAAALVLRQAHELKKRFNDVFWMPDENYFVMCLDPKGRQVKSIGSDPGDALATGIIAGERVAPTVERLFSPEMFSGWGIRTLSSKHIAFNPYSYHRGSVWPSENAAIGVGLRRYGYTDRLAQLTRAQLEIAERFPHVRLPEVICGHGKSPAQPFPAVYPKSCSPQAWSAGAPLILLQMILGIYPYAPFETLFLDPYLPDWLPEFKLERLRVGRASVDLVFRRNQRGESEYQVTRLDGKLRLVRQPSPWSRFATPWERVEDLIDSYRAA